MKHYRQETGMNLIANFAVLSSRRAIFDLSVCDLGWDDALVFINELLSIPVGQTSISFVNARSMLMSLRDSEYRAVLAQNLLLPHGPGLDFASKVAHGSPFPASLKAVDFVPALLTYMEVPRRIGLIGSAPEAVRTTAATFRRHAPWHEFIIISDGFSEAADKSPIVKNIDRHGLDLLIVGASSVSEEKWIHKNIRADHARLVLAVGKLFDVVGATVDHVPKLRWLIGPHRSYRGMQDSTRPGLQYTLDVAAFLYHVLKHGLTRRKRILRRSV